MAVILDNLRFYDRDTTVQVQGRDYIILAHQLMAWVSLTQATIREFTQPTPRFPAVLDPGFNDNFLIHQDQLHRFAGLQPRHFVRFNRMLRAHERSIPVYIAKVWLHHNQPSERDKFADAAPFPLDMHPGIGPRRLPTFTFIRRSCAAPAQTSSRHRLRRVPTLAAHASKVLVLWVECPYARNAEGRRGTLGPR